MRALSSIERRPGCAHRDLRRKAPGCLDLLPSRDDPGQAPFHKSQGLAHKGDAPHHKGPGFLGDIWKVIQLQKGAKRLWPCIPSMVAPMGNWLVDAKAVVSRRASHAEASLRVRQEVYLKQVVSGILQEGQDEEPIWEKADPSLAWRHSVLIDLLSQLDDLETTVTDVEKRLTFARTVHQETIEKYDVEWEEAITSIRDECPQYTDLTLKPQLGLVPIGRDPDSGLWEFAHLQTGEIPDRDENGELVLTEEMGIVFVLIPGGMFRMGAQKTDPDAPNYDKDAQSDEGPVLEVTLDSFFLSKYEMTQTQWERFVGKNPSLYGAHDYRANWDRTPARKRKRLMGLHPVEQVSWDECEDAMRRLDLMLPTEAQWEFAARAGTSTFYFPGNEVTSLQGTANIADGFAEKNGGSSSWKYESGFDDGYTVHSPIGRFKANRFGLHDVHGNVNEWCRDWYGLYNLPVTPGNGERKVSGARLRVYRGGGFASTASVARSAYRNHSAPDSRYNYLGCRPSRRITTK